MRKPKLSKGTLVTCPYCKRKIARLLVDVFVYEVLKASDFEPVDGYELRAHERMECKDCGGPYFAYGRLHTDKGWQ